MSEKEKKQSKPRKRKYDYKYLLSGSKMKCSDCGKLKATRPDVYKKRMDEAGSEEALRNYKCSSCRPKAEKKPKAKKEKKN